MMNRWMLFLLSLGSIFIVIYPTKDGTKELLILGILLILIASLGLYLNWKKEDRK